MCSKADPPKTANFLQYRKSNPLQHLLQQEDRRKTQRGAYPLVFSIESIVEDLPMSIAFWVSFSIISITLGPLVIIFGYLYFRRRGINKRELQSLRNDIAQIRDEIMEIKEQIADYIIKTH